MDNNRFFIFIWRVNALVLAGIFLFAFIMFLYETVLRPLTSPRLGVEVVNVDETDDTLAESFVISTGGVIDMQNKIPVTLLRNQQYGSGYSSKSTIDTQINQGVHDPFTGQTTWIFPTNNQLITQTTRIQRQTSAEHIIEKAPISGYLITFSDQDTNDDQRLSHSDDKTLLALSADGSKQKLILSKLHAAPQIRYLDDDSIALFFTDETGQHSARYDPKTVTIGPIWDIALPQ